MPTLASSVTVESERLFKLLLDVDCTPGNKWTLERCREIAPLTAEINELKRDRNAVLLAHSYVNPEIVYGVADYRSDSYALSLAARDSGAEVIVFAGVVFMAETAKVLSPNATVLVPDRASGCSLADSLTAEQLRVLKREHPDAAVVCYINSSAEVKAESDVCVTSGNAYKIVERLREREILFVPDSIMAANLQRELASNGVDKLIHTSSGSCIVHDQFSPEIIEQQRQRYPDLIVVSHPECTPDIVASSDFVGSTGAMMNYVQASDATYFMVLTECGLVSRLEAENNRKRFIASCKLCPYMKLNSLRKIRDVLVAPEPEQIIEVDPTIADRARASIDRMFALAG
jgi:quinolinate synthase